MNSFPRVETFDYWSRDPKISLAISVAEAVADQGTVLGLTHSLQDSLVSFTPNTRRYIGLIDLSEVSEYTSVK